MARQIINIGTADKGNGDPIRIAFDKVNDNFAEIYTALGLDENGLNLGSFEFNGSTITTTDSSGVTIDQVVNLSSDVNVGGNIVPNTANGGDLGSSAKPWRSLYVSSNTIFIGSVPISIDDGGNLLVGGAAIADVGTAAWDNVTGKPTFSEVATSGSYADLSNRPTIPADIGDLTDTGNLLFDGDYSSLTNQPVIPVDVSDLTDTTNLFFDRSYLSLTDTPTIPTDVSDLTDTGNLLGPGSELVGATVPAVGGTASANETGITYSNKIAIFTEGAFTVGVWTDVQIGWTVTDNNGFTDTIASRGGFGAASFVTTVNNWPAPASGKTYVFTSPDYQPASVSPVEITVGSNDWTFDNNGGLTLPTGVTNNGRIINDNGISLKVDSSYWTFGTDSSLTIPGDIQSENDVNITVDSGDSSAYTWNFGQTGDLSLPGGGLLGQVWGDGIDTELTLKSPPGVGDSGYVALSSANERNYVEVSNIGVVLGVEFGQAGFKKLTFGTDGNLKSADGEPLQILSTGASGAVSMAWSSSLDSPENIALVIANSPGVHPNSGAVDIVVGAIAGPNIWTFDPSGALTIPGDIQSEEDISIRINLSDSTTRTWRFGEDGDLTFPDGTVQTTAFAGNAATIDITDTNGIDTNYYLTFVENRDGEEILRADIDLTFNSATNTLTAGNITTSVLKIDDGVHEKFQTKADATGVVTHDCALGHIIYHTSPDDYFTVNLTNLNLASGYATSITVVVEQGATGYGPNALQIGGVAQTINWQGGSLPASPTANGVDVLVFSILNNNGTYTVLAQVTGFNEVA